MVNHLRATPSSGVNHLTYKTVDGHNHLVYNCPGSELECNVCISGTVPDSFLLKVSGLANGSCSDCDTLNGEFVVTYNASLSATYGYCIFTYFWGGLRCNSPGWGVAFPAGDQMRVLDFGGGDYADKFFDSPYDCSDPTPISMGTFSSTNGRCSGTSATATVEPA
jgi:hypothetical protein